MYSTWYPMLTCATLGEEKNYHMCNMESATISSTLKNMNNEHHLTNTRGLIYNYYIQTKRALFKKKKHEMRICGNIRGAFTHAYEHFGDGKSATQMVRW